MSGFEVIGVIAAAGQFIEQTVKLVKAVRNKSRDAPAETQHWIQELETLKDIAAEVQQTAALQTPQVEKILRRCEDLSRSLYDIFDSVSCGEDANLGKKTWAAINGVAQEGKIKGLFTDLDREKSSLVAQATTANLKATESIGKHLREIHRDLRNIPLPCDSESISPATEEARCRRDLFVTDPINDRRDVKTAKGEVVPGTCDWIVRHRKYQAWLESEGGALWISGGPGMGKTMLSVHLTEHLEELAKNSTPTPMALYFFCTNATNARSHATCILRGLLSQLISHQPSLSRYLLPHYKVQGRRMFGENSIELLWAVFLEAIADAAVSKVFCLLDGIDEGDSASMRVLLGKMRTLGTLNKVNAIIVSREHPTWIRDSLGSWPRIRLDPDSKDEVGHSLSAYIDARIEELARMTTKRYSSELLKKIKTALRDGSGGTFLWVSFALQDVYDKEPGEAIACLDTLPRGLDQVYERILREIAPGRQDLVFNLLQWVLFSVKPLRVAELADALDLGSVEGMTKSDRIRDVVTFCGHLLSVVPSPDTDVPLGDVVQIVHASARDYLLSLRSTSSGEKWPPQFDPEAAHAAISYRCVEYLTLQCLEGGEHSPCYELGLTRDRNIRTNVSEKLPLAEYSRLYWPIHFQSSGTLAKDFLRQNSDFFNNPRFVDTWYRSSRPRKLRLHLDLIYCSVQRQYLPFTDSRNPLPALHIASDLGLAEWVTALTDSRKWQVTYQNPFPALQIAYQRGLTDSVKANMGREIWPVRCRRRVNDRVYFIDEEFTALDFAAQNGHLDVVKHLVDHGATINFASRPSLLTPLGLSILADDPNMADLLLPAGAHVGNDSKDPERNTMTHVAENGSSREVAEVLLRHGASVKTPKRRHSTHLHTAAGRGNVPLIEFFLQHTPQDVGKRNYEGFTPLHCAFVWARKMEAVRVLLTATQADPHATIGGIMNWSVILKGVEKNVPLPLLRLALDHCPRQQSTEASFEIVRALYSPSRSYYGGAYRSWEMFEVLQTLTTGWTPGLARQATDGSTALHELAFHAANVGRYDDDNVAYAERMMSFLVYELGLAPNGQNKNGLTALHTFVERSSSVPSQLRRYKSGRRRARNAVYTLHVIKAFLGVGADPRIRDNTGMDVWGKLFHGVPPGAETTLKLRERLFKDLTMENFYERMWWFVEKAKEGGEETEAG